MPGPLSQMRMAKRCGVVAGVEDEFGAAAARIAVGVARQLRHRGGDAGLVLSIESQQFGDAMRALTDRDDIALVLDRHGDDGPDFGAMRRHGLHHFATSTVASSRCRAKSR